MSRENVENQRILLILDQLDREGDPGARFFVPM